MCTYVQKVTSLFNLGQSKATAIMELVLGKYTLSLEGKVYGHQITFELEIEKI